MAAPRGTILPHVKLWRDRRWLTQLALAERAGVKLSTIQRVERGESVSATTVQALAQALEVKPEQLVYGESAQPVTA